MGASDPVRIAQDEALRALNEVVNRIEQQTSGTQRLIRDHIEQHRRTERNRRWALGTLSVLMVGLLGLGLSLLRSATTAEARTECHHVATQDVRDARAEHAELRAADQRLNDRQTELDGKLSKVAMHRLGGAKE